MHLRNRNLKLEVDSKRIIFRDLMKPMKTKPVQSPNQDPCFQKHQRVILALADQRLDPKYHRPIQNNK